jgi:hypothetical protein
MRAQVEQERRREMELAPRALHQQPDSRLDSALPNNPVVVFDSPEVVGGSAWAETAMGLDFEHTRAAESALAAAAGVLDDTVAAEGRQDLAYTLAAAVVQGPESAETAAAVTAEASRDLAHTLAAVAVVPGPESAEAAAAAVKTNGHMLAAVVAPGRERDGTAAVGAAVEGQSYPAHTHRAVAVLPPDRAATATVVESRRNPVHRLAAAAEMGPESAEASAAVVAAEGRRDPAHTLAADVAALGPESAATPDAVAVLAESRRDPAHTLAADVAVAALGPESAEASAAAVAAVEGRRDPAHMLAAVVLRLEGAETDPAHTLAAVVLRLEGAETDDTAGSHMSSRMRQEHTHMAGHEAGHTWRAGCLAVDAFALAAGRAALTLAHDVPKLHSRGSGLRLQPGKDSASYLALDPDFEPAVVAQASCLVYSAFVQRACPASF